MEEQLLEKLAEGVAFTFAKRGNAMYLTDEDFSELKRIIKGYIKQGDSFDQSFKEWYEAKYWAK